MAESGWTTSVAMKLVATVFRRVQPILVVTSGEFFYPAGLAPWLVERLRISDGETFFDQAMQAALNWNGVRPFTFAASAAHP